MCLHTLNTAGGTPLSLRASAKHEALAYTELDTTRQISKYADLCGYDGVEFRNIADKGGRKNAIPHNETSNVYIAFDNTQVKSADPVTYDDEGNVIPLSERFNNNNPDIRYSMPDVDNFNVDDYNEKYIDNSQEYAMVMSAIRKQDGENFTSGQVRKVYAYDRSYLYYYDKNGKPIIVEKNISSKRGANNEFVTNYHRKEIDVNDDRFRNGKRNSANSNGFSNNRSPSTTDDRLSNREISSERRSDRTGYTESGNNINRNEEADGLTPAFSMPENKYSLSPENLRYNSDKRMKAEPL